MKAPALPRREPVELLAHVEPPLLVRAQQPTLVERPRPHALAEPHHSASQTTGAVISRPTCSTSRSLTRRSTRPRTATRPPTTRRPHSPWVRRARHHRRRARIRVAGPRERALAALLGGGGTQPSCVDPDTTPPPNGHQQRRPAHLLHHRRRLRPGHRPRAPHQAADPRSVRSGSTPRRWQVPTARFSRTNGRPWRRPSRTVASEHHSCTPVPALHDGNSSQPPRDSLRPRDSVPTRPRRPSPAADLHQLPDRLELR